jgi:hypothetical protein
MLIIHIFLAPLIAMRDNHVATYFAHGLVSVMFGVVLFVSLDPKLCRKKVLSITISAVLFAATLAIGLALSAPINRALALLIGVLCITTWFVLIPVLVAHSRFYNPESLRIGKVLPIWWTRYSLTFFSIFYTLLATFMLPKSFSSGIVECQTAVIGWMLTYIAFTYPNRFVPQWLQKKLAD